MGVLTENIDFKIISMRLPSFRCIENDEGDDEGDDEGRGEGGATQGGNVDSNADMSGTTSDADGIDVKTTVELEEALANAPADWGWNTETKEFDFGLPEGQRMTQDDLDAYNEDKAAEQDEKAKDLREKARKAGEFGFLSDTVADKVEDFLNLSATIAEEKAKDIRDNPLGISPDSPLGIQTPDEPEPDDEDDGIDKKPIIEDDEPDDEKFPPDDEDDEPDDEDDLPTDDEFIPEIDDDEDDYFSLRKFDEEDDEYSIYIPEVSGY